jgi:hypothetical protein
MWDDRLSPIRMDGFPRILRAEKTKSRRHGFCTALPQLRNSSFGKVMIDTALNGLLWAQANLPADAYVDAIWASRYPAFTNGNAPKAKGRWPIDRAQPEIALSAITSLEPKAANVTDIRSLKKKMNRDRIADTVAQIGEQVQEQAKAL